MATLTMPFGDAMLGLPSANPRDGTGADETFPQVRNVRGAGITSDPHGQLGNFSVDRHRIFDETTVHG